MKCIAVVRVRGLFSNPPDVRKTMECLKLKKVNSCNLFADSPQNLGMLNLVRDFVAFGEVSKDTVNALLAKRGKSEKGKLSLVSNEKEIAAFAAKAHENPKALVELGISTPFFLSPPAGGYDETKFKYPKGALGRRSDMDKLLKAMLRI